MFLCAVLGSLGAKTAVAEETAAAEEKVLDQGAGPEFLATNDSEGFRARRLSVEYFPRMQHADHLFGLRASDYRYSQGDWARHGQKLSVLGRQLDPATLNGWTMDGGVFTQGGHTLLTLDGGYRLSLAKRTSVEVFINRDWVETRTSLDRGISYTFAGVAVDQGIGPHVTLVGVAGQQYFSDGNRRDHGRLRLIYQPSLDLGLTLQARFRAYHSSHDDVQGAYFNPEHYSESMLAIGWRQRYKGWMGSLVAGLGREKIDNAPLQPTRLFELGLQSPVRAAQSLRLRAGYNRSASFNGPNYHYRYVLGEWIVRF
ncbi:hypothetical protein [Cupriavidus sp. IDO]|uniref:hypothetical protein n=1 Tax=Cupriavidus sp. IDO TaxID=1539142 RepID=UPI000690842C|nr:hypothetical protein [Cupriavidus sp. IDO]KWR90734.1 hypothetical protein RM96_07410 [Cupriavidus sp. IDO]